jgi:hypothetical protein
MNYELPSAFDLAMNPPTKDKWKKSVKSAIHHQWEKKLKDEAANLTTLEYLNLEMCTLGAVHPVWKCGNDPMQVIMAMTKAKLLIQRYALGSNHCAGKYMSTSCPLCHGPPENLEHFLLECTKTHFIRKPYMKKIKKMFDEFYFQPSDTDDILRAILDCTILTWIPEEAAVEIEKITRRMAFQLHNSRVIQLRLRSKSIEPRSSK